MEQHSEKSLSEERKTFEKKSFAEVFNRLTKKIDKTQALSFEIFPLLKELQKTEIFTEKFYFFLDFLSFLSQILKLKSYALLEKYFIKQENPEFEEEVPFSESDEPIFFDLPRDRELYLQVFLPKVYVNIKDLEEVKLEDVKKLPFSELVKAVIKLVEEEKFKANIVEKMPEVSIEDYIERTKRMIEKKGTISFKNLLYELEKKDSLETIKVVYYFLSLLFLSFKGFCRLIQSMAFGEIFIVKRIDFC